MIPGIWAESSVGDYSKYFIVISVQANTDIQTETFYFGDPIAGNIRVSISEVGSTIYNEPLSIFYSWTAADFISSRGVIGTGTDFINDLSEDLVIEIENLSNSAIMMNDIKSIDSARTLTLKFLTQPSLGGVANGVIYPNLA